MSYVYLIGWSKLDKWYYGVRCANKSSPENDLWKEYFTSSKYVAEFVSEHGDPDVIRVIDEFENCTDATNRERELLIENHAYKNDAFLNRAIIHSTGLAQYWIDGTPKSETHKANIAKALTGRKRDASVFEKGRRTKLERYGNASGPKTETVRARTSQSMKNNWADLEKREIRLKARNAVPDVKCPYCDFEAKPNVVGNHKKKCIRSL